MSYETLCNNIFTFCSLFSLILSYFLMKTAPALSLISQPLMLPQRQIALLSVSRLCLLPAVRFLVADTRLYNPLCLSVGRSVSRSVCRSVCRSVGRSLFAFSAFSGIFGITAPAHPHATSVAVYTALFPSEIGARLPNKVIIA